MQTRWMSYLAAGVLAGSTVAVTSGWQWMPSAAMRTNTALAQQHTLLAQLHMVTSQVGWAVADQHVVRTANGGQTWQVLGPRIPTGAITLLAGDDVRNAGIVVETGSVAPFAAQYEWTTNGGQTWHVGNLPWAHVYPPSSVQMVTPRDGWILTGTIPEAGSETAVVLHTTDGGARWEALPSSAFPPNGPSTGNGRTEPHGLTIAWDKNGVTFRSPQVGWVTGGDNYPREVVFDRTTNGGKTFTPQALPSIEGQTVGETDPPIFTTSQTGWLPVQTTDGRGFERTTNGGQTWLPTPTVFNARNISWGFVGAQDGWVLANHRLYRTMNGGGSWTPIARGHHLPHWTSIDFVTTLQGWATTTSVTTPLWETTDGGVTWKPIAARLSL